MFSPTRAFTQKLCQHEDRHGETLQFQKPSSAKSSAASAKEREAQEIASDILAQAFSTLRITVLKPQAIAQLRAEVQRTLAQRLTIRDWAA